jgi:hypothetical protein
MTRVFRNAIELDEYLANLTDEDRAQWRPNVALQDQVKAAQSEGIAGMEEILKHKARWVPHYGLPEWVRLGQYDALLKWHEGRVLTCVHMPRPDKPLGPVFAAAWKPGCVVCDKCTPMLAVTGVADTICDGCGHECKGMPDDGICPVSTVTGSLVYWIGVCVRCHEDMLRTEREASESEQ